MKKKDLKIIIITVIAVFVVTRTFPLVMLFIEDFIDRTSPQPTVMAIGPNCFEARYFYRCIESAGQHPRTGIKRLDLETDEDIVVFEVEDSEHDRIKSITQEGDAATILVSRTGLEPEEVMYHLDPKEGISDPVAVDESDIDPASIHHIYEDEQTIEHEMEDGSIVTLHKTFGKTDFTCTVDGKTYQIESISRDSNKYAKITNLYDRDGVIYAMITVPKYSINENNMKVINSSFDIDEEVVFKFDTATGENEFIYYTGSGRIVGYTDDRVFVMRGRKIKEYYNVNVRFVQSGNNVKLSPCKDVAVKWLGKRAVVYNSSTGEILGRLAFTD